MTVIFSESFRSSLVHIILWPWVLKLAFFPNTIQLPMKSFCIPVSIHTTARPPTDSDITQHISIRLAALRTDPDSFSSTFARESTLGREKWKERLEQEGVSTFYARRDEVGEFNERLGPGDQRLCHHCFAPVSMSGTIWAPKIHTLDLSSYVAAEGRGSDAHMSQTSLPWLATLTLLSPSFLNLFLSSSCVSITPKTASLSNPTWPLTLLGPEIDIWLIVGLWVRPEWRRKGIGQKIVQQAVRFVINSLAHSHSDTACAKTTLILLEVYTRNTAAVELYRSLGFEIFSNPEMPASTAERSHLQANRAANGGIGEECDMDMHKSHWMGYTIPPLCPYRSNLWIGWLGELCSRWRPMHQCLLLLFADIYFLHWPYRFYIYAFFFILIVPSTCVTFVLYIFKRASFILCKIYRRSWSPNRSIFTPPPLCNKGVLRSSCTAHAKLLCCAHITS